MAYVYILWCYDGSYYVGCSQDYIVRIRQHEAGLVKYTKSRLPALLIYLEEYKTLGEARTRENRIKGWKKRKNIENLIKRGAVV